MPQNFGSIISRAILDKLSFDFYENGENRFVERVEFYNKLMEKVISQDKINNAFIAGGFFLKYKRDKKFNNNNKIDEMEMETQTLQIIGCAFYFAICCFILVLVANKLLFPQEVASVL